jgi:ubiquinol-cytochrome c reductase iron-sulfur subunit
MSSVERYEVNIDRRKLLTGATGVMGAIGATFVAVPFVGYWQPSEKVKAAGAPVDVNISKMQLGQMLTIAWRGKPVWIIRRTPEMLSMLNELKEELRDFESESSAQPKFAKNKFRSFKPEYLVVIGVCTHLGCAPLYRPSVNSADMAKNWKGGVLLPMSWFIF